MIKKIKNTLLNVSIMVASTIFFLLILELFFIFFIPQIYTPPQVQPTNSTSEIATFFEYDELLGWKLKPNSTGFMKNPEFNVTISISQKGLRDKDYPYNKTGNEKRIIVLGDSFTLGVGVEENERFTEVLENQFLDNVDVINMGVSGYGTDQELLFLEKEGFNYNPDIVLVAFYIGNDVSDNMHNFMPQAKPYPKPMFVLKEDNELKLTNVPVPKINENYTSNTWERNISTFVKIKSLLRSKSHTYNFISNRLLSLPFTRKILIDLSLTENIDDGEEVTKKIIGELKNICDKNNANIVLLIIPNKNQVYDKSYPHLINDNIINFAEENNISVVNLLPTFLNNNDEQLYLEEGHWNAAGHQLAAEILNYKLREENLL